MDALVCDFARLPFTLHTLIENLPPRRGRPLTREQIEAVAA